MAPGGFGYDCPPEAATTQQLPYLRGAAGWRGRVRQVAGTRPPALDLPRWSLEDCGATLGRGCWRRVNWL